MSYSISSGVPLSPLKDVSIQITLIVASGGFSQTKESIATAYVGPQKCERLDVDNVLGWNLKW